MTAIHNGVHLAEGFHITDNLASPYQIAYGHIKCAGRTMWISNIDLSEKRELLTGPPLQRGLTTCFSPDGTTLYGYDTDLWAKDIQTGTVRTLPPVPHTPKFDETTLCECSPDNRILLLMQTGSLHFVRGSAQSHPFRLCRLTTEGTDFRVLYEDPAKHLLHFVFCCWEQGFGLLRRFKELEEQTVDELCKLDLNSGQLTVLGQLSSFGWGGTLRPDGTKYVWATTGDELYTYSLVDGRERVIPVAGTCPTWSPDGRYIAYMEDQHKLCLWDTTTGRTQDIVWFEPPNLTRRERKSSFAVMPRWSPDRRMLWFALAQTRRLPPPRNLSHVLTLARGYIYPILHNLNPMRTSRYGGYRPHYDVFKTGIVDLTTQQVLLHDRYEYGVTWLPRSEVAAKV